LLSRLDWLTDIDKHAGEIQLQIGRSQDLTSSNATNDNKDTEEDSAILLSLLSASHNQVIGSRTLEEIAARYMKRIGAYQDIERTQSALRFLSEFTTIRGTLEKTKRDAELLTKKWGLEPSALSWISEFASKLAEYPLSNVSINCDFSLTHDVRYYTGMVFEILVSGIADYGSNTACSGGRYDKLYRSLGAPTDTPALGFAHSVEALLNDKSGCSDSAPFTETGILILPTSQLAVQYAHQCADQFRASGQRVGMLLDTEPSFDLYDYAKTNMISRILWIGQNSIEKEQDLDE